MRQEKIVFAPLGNLDLGAVPNSGSGARYLAINGVQHVSKCRSHSNGVWVCFNEFLAARAASPLGVPVPPYRLVSFRGGLASTEIWFCSKLIKPGDSADAVSFTKLQNRETLGNVIIFDLWLCNTDRKNAHLYVEKLPDGAERLFAIDHGHTLLTSADLPRLRSAEFGDGARILPGCPDLVASIKNVNQFASALQSLQSLTDQEIAEWVEDSPSEWVPDNSVLKELKEFLFKRRDNIASVLQASSRLFPNLGRGDV